MRNFINSRQKKIYRYKPLISRHIYHDHEMHANCSIQMNIQIRLKRIFDKNIYENLKLCINNMSDKPAHE